MRRKSLWLLVSAVIILAMLLTACKTEETATITTTAATTTATTTAATTTVITTTTTTTTTSTTTGAPKYGGKMNVTISADLTSYDSWATNPHAFTRMIYDGLLQGDIMTSEEEWPAYSYARPQWAVVSCIIETWDELGYDNGVGTVILHVRQGVHFQNLPPVNGRELTADDVVYSWKRSMDLKGQAATSQNIADFTKSITAVDKYTVELKYNPNFMKAGWWSYLHLANTWPVANEVVDKYNGSLANPIGQVGTGPYIIRDYVPGSSFTCVKNPDYWNTDPRFPGNKLPYTDTVVTTVIPDLSTQLAAMRTGKIDRMTGISRAQALSLNQNNPELMSRKQLPEVGVYISPRNNIPPFSDVRVRQAMSMAIDRHAIVDQYYGGDAAYSPYLIPEHWPQYVPLDRFSQEIQDIYNYHPDKARQLLAEAGYPDGFQTSVNVASNNTNGIDVMQLCKAWWADIGVTVNIKVLDPAAHSSIRYAHTFPGMALGGGGINDPSLSFSYLWQPPGTSKVYATTEWANVTYNEKYLAYTASWDKPQAEQDALLLDLVTYTREQTPYIDLPSPATYLFWQPWLKGHWGQSCLTFGVGGDFYKYMWIDKD